jgi:hypothetical protein
MSNQLIEESYPLSALQQGMLFYNLRQPQVGVEIEQIVIDFHEELNVPLFQEAWQSVVSRHSVLRTAFDWTAPEPLQSVYSDVVSPWQVEDWRASSEQAEKLENYLENDRRRGFNLAEAPLVRFALFRLDEAEYKFVWTFHHILMDGHSHSLILQELFGLYDSSASLPESKPYQQYMEWIGEQDLSSGEAFWRDSLSGFTTPTPLPKSTLDEQRGGYGEQEISLSSELTSALNELAETHQLATSTLLEGAWALLLSRYSGEADVVFGAVRSCRDSSIEGAETMVGLLINTLPVRASLPTDTSLLSCLKELEEQNLAVAEYEQTPLVDVQAWSDIEGDHPLFENIFVFDQDINSALNGSAKREARLIDQSAYPLTFYGYEGEPLLLKLSYQRQHFDEATIGGMLGDLQRLLTQMAANPQAAIDSLTLLTDAEKQELVIDAKVIGPKDAARPSAPAPTSPYVPPTNQLEEAIASIWQELLNRSQVGRNDNFFDLGGNSLLAAQAHRRLLEVTEKKISVMELFCYPSIRTLSQYLESKPVAKKDKSSERVQSRLEAMKKQQARRRK